MSVLSSSALTGARGQESYCTSYTLLMKRLSNRKYLLASGKFNF